MLEFISKSIVSNRKKRGLTQEELAEKLDVSSAAISKWERGISTPELSMVCKIADCFEISVDELLGRTNMLLSEEDKTIQLILRKLNNTTLVYALAGASGVVCKRFMDNLSGRMISFLDTQLERNEFPVEKIEDAQKAILQIYSMIR